MIIFLQIDITNEKIKFIHFQTISHLNLLILFSLSSIFISLLATCLIFLNFFFTLFIVQHKLKEFVGKSNYVDIYLTKYKPRILKPTITTFDLDRLLNFGPHYKLSPRFDIFFPPTEISYHSFRFIFPQIYKFPINLSHPTRNSVYDYVLQFINKC